MAHQKYIPEVKFELAPIELEAETLCTFSLKERRLFGAMINKVYPELEDIVRKTNSEDEAILKCREFSENIIEKNMTAIFEAKDSFQNDWNLINKEFLETLSKHFETEWPRDKSVITGYISMVPVFPRFLESYSFCVGYRVKTAIARDIIAHEIVHLLWFKKWKEVFPDIPADEYESPHLTWRLSEIMDPIILQYHPIIKNLVQPIWGYNTFKGLKIGNVGMIEYFINIYKKCMQDGLSFEETLKALWKEAQKNKEVLGKF